MDLQLRGKRALVTGSTAGIGFAAAGLYKEGHERRAADPPLSAGDATE